MRYAPAGLYPYSTDSSPHFESGDLFGKSWGDYKTKDFSVEMRPSGSVGPVRIEPQLLSTLKSSLQITAY